MSPTLQDLEEFFVLRRTAWTAVNHAIKAGKIVKPLFCEECGRSGKIQAHHSDYSDPLKIRFLCLPCHRSLHAKARREAALRLGLAWPRTKAVQ